MAPPNPRIGSSTPANLQDEQQEKFVLRQGFSEEISDEQALRINESQKDIKIEHALFEESMQKMSLVLSTAGNSKPKGLIIIGDSDSGKSTLLRAFCKKLEDEEERFYSGKKSVYESSETPMEHYSVKPAFMFSIPSGSTVNGILERALKLNGIPIKNRMTLTQLENLLYDRLRELKTRVILIDEFQDIARIGYRQQDDILKVIKEMTNNLSIPIIAAGTRASEPIIESDEQIYTRLRKIYLHPFEADHNFRDFLTAYGEKRINLQHKVDFYDSELAGKIHSRTNGLVGQVTQLLSMAVKHAILTKSERITVKTLEEIPFVPLNTALGGGNKRKKEKQMRDMGV